MLKRSLSLVVGVVFAAAFGVRLLATQTPPVNAAGALPDAKDVIAKFVTAIGGASAHMAITSIHIRGTLEVVGQGLTGTVEIFSSRPSNALLRADIVGLGLQEQGFDGTHGWRVDPVEGPVLLKDKELQQMREDSDFDADLHLPARVKSMKTLDRVEFDGHQAYKLSVVSMSGDESIEYYDVMTYLGLGTENQRESPMGTLSVTNFTRDYKKFGNVMMPTTLDERAMQVDQIIRVQSVEFDKVPAGTFDPPPAVKALIK